MKILSIFKAFLLTSLLTFSSLKSLIPCIEIRKKGDQTLILLHDCHLFHYSNLIKHSEKYLIHCLKTELNQPIEILKAIKDSKIEKQNILVLNEIVEIESKDQILKDFLEKLYVREIYKNEKSLLGIILDIKKVEKESTIEANKIRRGIASLSFLNFLINKFEITCDNLECRNDASNLITISNEIDSYKNESKNNIINKYYKNCANNFKKSKTCFILLLCMILVQKRLINDIVLTFDFNNFNECNEEFLKWVDPLLEAKILHEILNCKNKIMIAHFGAAHIKRLESLLDNVGFKKIDKIGLKYESIWHFILLYCKFLTSFRLDLSDKHINNLDAELLLQQAQKLNIYNFLMKHLAPEKQIRSKL